MDSQAGAQVGAFKGALRVHRARAGPAELRTGAWGIWGETPAVPAGDPWAVLLVSPRGCLPSLGLCLLPGRRLGPAVAGPEPHRGRDLPPLQSQHRDGCCPVLLFYSLGGATAAFLLWVFLLFWPSLEVSIVGLLTRPVDCQSLLLAWSGFAQLLGRPSFFPHFTSLVTPYGARVGEPRKASGL